MGKGIGFMAFSPTEKLQNIKVIDDEIIKLSILKANILKNEMIVNLIDKILIALKDMKNEQNV